MTDIKGFIISLIAASATSAVIEGILPESDGKNGMKKYLRYLISLAIVLMLLSPLKILIAEIPSFALEVSANGIFSYESVDAIARANSLVALHIGEAVCDKFSLDPSEVSAEMSGNGVIITLKKRFGILGRDISDYIFTNFGVTAEVIFYE